MYLGIFNDIQKSTRLICHSYEQKMGFMEPVSTK